MIYFRYVIVNALYKGYNKLIIIIIIIIILIIIIITTTTTTTTTTQNPVHPAHISLDRCQIIGYSGLSDRPILT
jgi:competence protein ComGC